MIVIGGSLGGMKAVRTIFRSLPPSFPEPIAVVLHRQKDSDDALLDVLRSQCQLPINEVLDKEPIQPCHIWLAPADYHLLIEDDHLSLSVDEPVSFARPSIDVLFESAADAYGEEVIGIVLTGANQDGAKGAAAIERLGGTLIIEDPRTAECPVMPTAALSVLKNPHVRSGGEIASLLLELSATLRGRKP